MLGCTFKPLSGNRYRVNGGPIVKKARIGAYRMESFYRHRPAPPAPTAATIAVRINYATDVVKCPACLTFIDFVDDAGTITCKCGATIQVTRHAQPRWF